MLPWNESSERTFHCHLQKVKQGVSAVLDEVAPNQSETLWHSLGPSLNQQFSSDSESEGEEVDNKLMNALTECYSNASTWDIQRQILSIMADKATFRTRYRFSIARKHTILHGRGFSTATVVPE